MDATEAQEGIEDAVKDAPTRKLALLIAALAALLAIVGMQDDNSAQDAVQSNIQASDLWAFFQAKSLRQFTLERQSEVLKIEREGAPPERQAAIDLDIVTYYGQSIVEIAEAVRRNVIERIEGMTGLEVTEVNVNVDDLFVEGDHAEQRSPARVQ